MGNILYRKIIGELNPKQPNQFFNLLIPPLRLIGMWPPDNENKWVQNLYNCYSILFRFFFLHMYAFGQAMFFKEIKNFWESSMILFILLTQFSLIYKLEKFYSNRHRIKECVRVLNDDANIPKNEEEDKIIKKSSMFMMNFFIFYTVPMSPILVSWASLAFQPGFLLPVPSWYPFELAKYPNYYFAFAYNYIGIVVSATCNVFTDFTVTALLLSTKAQIERLGLAVEKIGCGNTESSNEVTKNGRKIIKTFKLKSQSTIDLKNCILRHKQLLQFTADIEDIFRDSIFCQLIFTTFIVCMTLLVIADLQSSAEMVPVVGYLNTMIQQMFLLCWPGNEVTVAWDKMTQKIFSSNFIGFDRDSSRLILIFLQRSLYPSKIKAGNIFKVTLNIPTFMDILKSSYSYFTVLRTMR